LTRTPISRADSSNDLICFGDLPSFGVFFLGALAALIVAAPVALYFVLSDK